MSHDYATTVARKGRQQAQIVANRVSRETMLHYTEFLPEIPRAIMTAHLDLGMDAKELAILHGVSHRQMRQRINRLRTTLTDPCFLLAAQYADRLPAGLAPVAQGYWIDGLTLRELAKQRQTTLHRTRLDVVLVRSLLVVLLSGEHTVSSAQACAALQHGSDIR